MTTEIQQTMEPIVPQQEANLQAIIALANDLKTNGELIVETEKKLKELKDKYKLVSESHLPAMMESVGLTEVHLTTGEIIRILPQYFGSVAQSRMAAAVAWLKARNMDGIVTREYKLDTDEPFTAEDLQQMAEVLGCPVSEKQTIHPSTLKAFVRERLEANDPEFPKELFAASQVNRAILSE